MKSLILSLAIVATTLSVASADPIADRKALMKERGGLVGQLAPIAKGEQPFDAAKVSEVFAALQANADKYDVDALFTADSKMGDTKASPKIWDDMAGYKAAVDKYKADVTAAAAAKPQDVDAFRAEFGKVTANCGGCHQAWRL
jgi:cytochrome c556